MEMLIFTYLRTFFFGGGGGGGTTPRCTSTESNKKVSIVSDLLFYMKIKLRIILFSLKLNKLTHS